MLFKLTQEEEAKNSATIWVAQYLTVHEMNGAPWKRVHAAVCLYNGMSL